mgnify:CR=1 FL=1|jgi:N-acylneuraminate cytidylyltransferase|tara:strand:- start:1037 stop:1750 length:714 start_codon:yes stop_codon:yes gene_type:complete
MKNLILAVILARSGSKGIKNKNIKILNGKPLIAWSIATCLKSKRINKIVVSTDSKKYAKIAKSFGAHEIILRPKKFSKDLSTDYDAILHLIKNFKKFDYEIIAHIRPTTPNRDVKDVDRAIQFFEKSNFSSLRSVHEMPETAYKSLELNSKNFLKPLKNIKQNLDQLNRPRQYFKKTYTPNGVIDIYRKNFILKNKKLFGKKVLGFKTKFAHEIDTLDQFKFINNNFGRKYERAHKR